MYTLNTFRTFVEEVSACNSRLYKMSVLEKYARNRDVIEYLKFIFNPYVITGLSKKKLSKQVQPEEGNLNTVFEVFDYVKQNHTGRDEDIAKIKFFEQRYLTPSQKDLFEKILDKNIQLGVDVLTINKVMPGLIPTFGVMLANKYFDRPEALRGKSFSITTKIDGGRIIAMKKSGVVSLYTRAGQLYTGLVDIEKELEALDADDFVLDGEITLLNREGLSSKDQYKQTMMITRKDGEKHGVKILAFDTLPIEDFESSVGTQPYHQRRSILEKTFSALTYVEVLPVLYSGTDTQKVLEFLEQQIAKGEEGVMLNDNDAFYTFGRGDALLKVKKMHDADLQIVDFEAGTNANANRLGAFVVNYKGFRVRVGSGIKPELREEVWRNKAQYIGRTIIVQYFEETKNKQGGISLRFPVFVDFRDDK